MIRRTLLLLLTILLLSGLSSAQEIKDLEEISQDHRIFTERQAGEFNRLNADLQKKADTFHNEMFFSPWRLEKSLFSLEEVQFEFDKYGKNPGYGRKGKKHSATWTKKLAANAHLKNYPNGGFPAITVKNTDLRVLPTSDSHLSNPKFCGLPFDNMQNSGAAANTPVFVSHISKDKRWCLAETHYAIGWMPSKHIVRVDGGFMKQWKGGPHAVIVKDKTPIYGKNRKLLFKAPLGLILPKAGENEDGIQIFAATTDGSGKASVIKAILSKKTVAVKPLPLTAVNMARIANELMNEPYGWGGLDGRRDCSSTLMDLFAPFGIWLPRNSNHQANRTGAFIALSNLSPEEKERTIIKQGIPYFTLVWLKGHIMLYIGERDGQALVFHNFWSVKTRDAKGNTGKKVVGKAAITTLRPGQELRQGKGPGDILPSILGMTLIWPPLTGPAILPPEKAVNYTPAFQ